MARALRPVVLLIVSTLALHGAQSTFRVLVTPPLKVARPLADLRPDEVRAVVGSTPYTVNSVERDQRLSSAPIIIVADFANTAAKYHPCIVSEILPFLRNNEARPGVSVITNGTSPEFIHHIEIGSGPGGLNILLSRYDDVKIRQWCDDARQSRPEPRYEDPYFTARDSSQALWGIIKGWVSSNRFVRVFWIAGDFAWFEAGDAPVCFDRPDAVNCTLDMRNRSAVEKDLSRYTSGLSKAGVTIFPILIPGTINTDIRERKRRDPVIPAQYMAAVSGGFVTNTEEAAVGISLARVIEAADQSYTLELTGPAEHDVELMNVTFPSWNWRRPIAIDPEEPVPEAARQLPFRSMRVYLPSKNFAVRFGCAPQCPEAQGPSISIFVPEFVATATPGNMYVLLDYVEPPNPFKHRKTLHRAPDSCLCVPIEEVEDKLEFRIVIYDEITQWLAAGTITFRKNK